jgi:hypothetical protein
MSYTPNQTGKQYTFYYVTGSFEIDTENNMQKAFRGSAKDIAITAYADMEFRIKTYNLTMPWCKLKKGKHFDMSLSYDMIGLEIEFKSAVPSFVELLVSGYVEDDIEYETTLQDFMDTWTTEKSVATEDLPKLCI